MVLDPFWRECQAGATNPQEALDSFIVDFETHTEPPQEGKSSLTYPCFSDNSLWLFPLDKGSSALRESPGWLLSWWNSQMTIPMVILKKPRHRMLLASPDG